MALHDEQHLEECLSVLRPLVEQLFAHDSSGHDIDHLERVLALALHIQQHEGGDRLVVGLAAYLHDIHRALENETGLFVTPLESLPCVRELLNHVEVSSKQVERVCFCIQHHEDYSWNNAAVDDLDALIVQDADNLDAMGAIGVARAFTQGGATGRALYDPATPLQAQQHYEELDAHDPSTLHHFFNKPLRLEESMHTQTARQLARQRNAVMQAFVDEFLAEWHLCDTEGDKGSESLLW